MICKWARISCDCGCSIRSAWSRLILASLIHNAIVPESIVPHSACYQQFGISLDCLEENSGWVQLAEQFYSGPQLRFYVPPEDAGDGLNDSGGEGGTEQCAEEGGDCADLGKGQRVALRLIEVVPSSRPVATIAVAVAVAVTRRILFSAHVGQNMHCLVAPLGPFGLLCMMK